jgi:hypothetical protein
VSIEKTIGLQIEDSKRGGGQGWETGKKVVELVVVKDHVGLLPSIGKGVSEQGSSKKEE